MMMTNKLVYLVNGLRPWHAKGVLQPKKEISLVHNVSNQRGNPFHQ